MKKLNIILALSLIGVSANALAKDSLAHQMWQFAYPDSHIPKQIPRHAKRAMAQPYGKKKGNVIFTDKENGNYFHTITIDADYGNGYLLLHTRLADEERTFSDEIVAFKDSKGKYTFFNSDVSYLKGYGIGKCTIYPNGRKFISNRPLHKVFPKITMQTFAPNIRDKALKDILSNLDVRFPRKGTTVTASIEPLQNRLGEPSRLQNILVDWAKQLNDKQSLNALMHGQPLNSDDGQVLAKMLQVYAGKNSEIKQETTRKEALEFLRRLEGFYNQNKRFKFSRIKLAWDRQQGRFHLANKIPTKHLSFYDYIVSLPRVEPSEIQSLRGFTCYDENYHGYGYIQ